MAHPTLSHPLAIQVLTVVGGLALMTLAPPPTGRILLVPVAGWSTGMLATAAIGRGARIAGRGPGGVGLVVIGERGRLGGLLRRGVVPVAAPAALCGAAA